MADSAKDLVAQQRLQKALHDLVELTRKHDFLDEIPHTDVEKNLTLFTHYLQSSSFSSTQTREEKFCKGRKIGEDMVEAGVIKYFCKSIKEARKNLPVMSQNIDLCFTLLLEVTNYSDKLCEEFMSYPEVLDYMRKFLEQLIESDNKKYKYSAYLDSVNIIGIIHNCCTCAESTVHKAREAGFTPLLKEILENPNFTDSMARMVNIATMADIMDEKDGGEILAKDTVNLELFIANLNESVSSTHGNSNGWFTFELCRVIRQFASYDIYKQKLVDLGALEPLVKAAKGQDDFSQIESLKAIAHLAFDPYCQKKMIEGDVVIETLMDLAKSTETNIRDIVNGAIWTMQEQLKKSDKYSEKLDNLHHKKVKGHVMISYSREQRQMLLDIRAYLEQQHFKVWMDVDQMRGDVYDRMSEAVENASVVLLGMSRSYKMSEYCRREAAYAAQLNKQIIPLKVERNYDPDGWLGLLTAGYFFYDFGRKTFEEMSPKLITELHRRAYTGKEEVEEPRIEKEAHGSFSAPPPSLPVTSSAPHTSALSQKFVLTENLKKFRNLERPAFEEWLDKYDLPRDKFAEIRPKDILYLARMKIEAPDSYYSLGPRLFKDKTNKLSKTQIMADLTEALDELHLS